MATQAYRDAIASIESRGSGDYAAIGPKHSKMGRALGRYQIMEANIGPWSKAALGRVVTPDEFMANPTIQDAIFDHQFGRYVTKFGPEGAAQAWFAGPGGVGKSNRKDVLGTDVGTYGQRFTKALGIGSQVAAQPASPSQAPGTPAPAFGDPITVGSSPVADPQAQGVVPGSFAPSAPQPQPQPSFAQGMTDFKNGDYLKGVSNVFGSMSAEGDGQMLVAPQPMQLAPIQGPTGQQATALANYVQSLLGRKPANG